MGARGGYDHSNSHNFSAHTEVFSDFLSPYSNPVEMKRSEWDDRRYCMIACEAYEDYERHVTRVCNVEARYDSRLTAGLLLIITTFHSTEGLMDGRAQHLSDEVMLMLTFLASVQFNPAWLGCITGPIGIIKRRW